MGKTWVPGAIPKMLRPYFLHHRELLGGLARTAWETVLELMRAAVGDEDIRPGMVTVVQTAGDLANWHPHVHALVSRGGWNRGGEWVPVGFVDEHSAELLFRHKVMRLLQGVGLLSDERIELLLSWRHTGFSVHNRVRVEPEDQPAVERRSDVTSPVFGGIGPRNTSIEEVSQARGGGPGDTGRGTHNSVMNSASGAASSDTHSAPVWYVASISMSRGAHEDSVPRCARKQE